MKQLTWSQIYRWRMNRQGLTERYPQGEMIPALRQMVAAQAQVLSAACLSIGARVTGLILTQINDALYRERSLFKTWAMRGTLHLVAADDLALLSAARSHEMDAEWIRYFEYYGLTSSQYQAFLEAVPSVLGADPLTRQQLAAAMAERMGQPELEQVFLASSWGSFWKPCAYAGTLVFGPGQGQHPTFVNPRKLLAEWPVIDPREARRELLRRFLSSGGPSTPADFAHWWNGSSWITRARALFREMEDELEQVQVDGQPMFALRGSADEIGDSPPLTGIRLIPLFDTYTFITPRSQPGIHAPRVFRPQGWISAVIVADGLIIGTWDYLVKPDRVVVTVQFFETPSTDQKHAVAEEAGRLSVFWEKPVELVITGG